MESVEVKRLDHHGIVAGVIDDLQLVEIVDRAVPPDQQKGVTHGEAFKTMIMNGLGFTNRPQSLTPQFFTNLPLKELFGKDITPEKLNRHKLGRSLDDFYDYGPEPLFSQISGHAFTEHKRYTKRGKPGPKNPVKKIQWQIHAEVDLNKQAIEQLQEQKACFVIGTNILDDGYSDTDIFFAYRGQSSVERGYRFLKDKAFFVCSLFLEKPTRIEALLMVMITALLVYSIAQRRLRQRLEEQEETIPNQINQPTQRPTLKWVFQLFEGINLIKLYFQCGEPEKTYVDNLNDLRIKIIRLLGENVCRKYMVRPSAAYG